MVGVRGRTGTQHRILSDVGSQITHAPMTPLLDIAPHVQTQRHHMKEDHRLWIALYALDLVCFSFFRPTPCNLMHFMIVIRIRKGYLLVILLSVVVDDVEEAELVDTLGGGDDTEPVTELLLLEELLGTAETVSLCAPRV